MDALPQVIRDYWYAIDWDVETLWALDLPVTTLPMAALAWHLDVPVWPGPDGNYSATPRQVLADPARHAVEFKRMLAADLAYPLEIAQIKGRWMILDGIHRLLKAHRMGLGEVSVRKVPDEHLDRLAD